MNFFDVNPGHFLIGFKVNADILLGFEYDVVALLIDIVEGERAEFGEGLSDIGIECFQG